MKNMKVISLGILGIIMTSAFTTQGQIVLNFEEVTPIGSCDLLPMATVAGSTGDKNHLPGLRRPDTVYQCLQPVGVSFTHLNPFGDGVPNWVEENVGIGGGYQITDPNLPHAGNACATLGDTPADPSLTSGPYSLSPGTETFGKNSGLKVEFNGEVHTVSFALIDFGGGAYCMGHAKEYQRYDDGNTMTITALDALGLPIPGLNAQVITAGPSDIDGNTRFVTIESPTEVPAIRQITMAVAQNGADRVEDTYGIDDFTYWVDAPECDPCEEIIGVGADLGAVLGDVQNDLVGIIGDVSGLAAGQAAIQASVGAIDGQVSALANGQTAIQSDLAAISANQANLQNGINSVLAGQATLEGKVDDLQADIDNIETILSNLPFGNNGNGNGNGNGNN